MEDKAMAFERSVILVLEDERKMYGIEQSKLSHLAFEGEKGNTRQIFKRMVDGNRRLKIAELYRLCMILGVTPERIFSIALKRMEILPPPKQRT